VSANLSAPRGVCARGACRRALSLSARPIRLIALRSTRKSCAAGKGKVLSSGSASVPTFRPSRRQRYRVLAFLSRRSAEIAARSAGCGKPVVTTDVPGCREVVIDGVNGRLVPPRNMGALAEALAELIASPEKRSAMGQAGRKMAEQEFSQTRIIAETLQVYRELKLPAA